MTREEAIKWLRFCAESHCDDCAYENQPIEWCSVKMKECVDVVEEALSAEPTDLVSLANGKYKKEFEDVKTAFEFEFAREVEDLRKRNIQLEALLKVKEMASAEKQASGDLISRADAIKAIESRQTEQWIDADVDYNNGLESAVAEIKALPLADRPNIAYICDGTACDGACDECHHTTDIEHAKNFKCVGGKYIETADRPSGEWICKDSADMSVYWFECSECGEKTPRDNFNHEYKSNYCPNCGAKMGGKHND